MKALVAAVLYGALLPAALAGAIVETVSREVAGGAQTATTTLYVEGGNLRVVNGEDSTGEGAGSNAIIKNNVMYAIDHGRRVYSVLDRAAMKQMALNMNQAMAAMRAKLDEMPPEKRVTMERLLDASPRGPVSYRKTARTETVADRKCRIWEGMQSERRLVEYCVVPYASVAGGPEIMAAMKNMMALMDEVFVAMDESGIKDAVFSNEWRGVRAIDGYPVLIRMFEAGRPVSEEVLRSARVAAVPASQFEVPAGYRLEKVQPIPGGVQSEEPPTPSIDPRLPED